VLRGDRSARAIRSPTWDEGLLGSHLDFAVSGEIHFTMAGFSRKGDWLSLPKKLDHMPPS
jgi:hypothetical protein